jgi:branched-chain amino acid transport system permease protein
MPRLSNPIAAGFLAAALAAAVVMPLVAPGYYVQFAAKAMLMGMVALGLNLVVGYGGLVSMCHAAFFGLAGYMLAFMTPESAGASIWLSLPAALLAVAAAAAVIGALSLRTRGIYFIMVTLAFGEMLFYLFHDTKIGGGSDGMYIYFKPELTLGGATLIDLESSRTFYYLVLALLIGAAFLVRGLVRSPFGHALAAARDNERRALSLGYPIFRIRLTAFVISAVIAGLAGYFSAAQFGFIAPQLLGWHLSATVLVMVVLGGMSSIVGPIVGAFALIGLEELLKSSFEHWKLIKGLIIIALVLALPGGLQQLASMLLPQPADDRTPPAPSSAPASAPAPVKEALNHV